VAAGNNEVYLTLAALGLIVAILAALLRPPAMDRV
jgi:hypothetical protein